MITMLSRPKPPPYPTDRLVSGEELAEHHEWGYCELVRGKVVPVTVPRPPHGLTVNWLAYKITVFVSRRKLGKVTCGDAGIYTARNPDSVRGPDIAFFSNERLKLEPHPVGYFTVAPDICVEVRSPGQPWREVAEKVDEYLAIGVRLVWVVDPLRREVHVYAPGRAVRVLKGKDRLDGEDVLPGFRLALGVLFAALD